MISHDFWNPWDLDSLPDQRSSKKGKKEGINIFHMMPDYVIDRSCIFLFFLLLLCAHMTLAYALDHQTIGESTSDCNLYLLPSTRYFFYL
jgi:hypothetical protein